MPIEVTRIIYAILVLLSLTTIYILALRIVIKIFSVLFRLLYKTAWFRRLLFILQTKLQQAIDYTSPFIRRLWNLIEVLIDPVFYGYSIVAVYDRVQVINQYVQNNPQYKFWDLLEANMNYDLSFWLAFTIIFTLWFFVRANTHMSDKIFQKRVLKSLNKLSGESDELDIGKINKEIREHLRKRKEK
ncbi:MAG TPA: hypothetical protein G4O20_04380 [Dehalococcoidia bacterium]|nr:hypothetical protein [Dehalococcoidia bacterium]